MAFSFWHAKLAAENPKKDEVVKKRAPPLPIVPPLLKQLEEAGITDPKLCQTIRYLQAYSCDEVEATGKSITKAYKRYSTERFETITEKVIDDASKGLVAGKMQILIALQRETTKTGGKHRTRKTYPWADVSVNPEFSRNTIINTPVDMQVLDVSIYFIANPDEAKDASGNMLYKDVRIERGGHATMLIIDHKHKTIEYSDPHGAAVWNPVVFESIRNFLRDFWPEHYRLLPPWETCPDIGVQALLTEGICGYFSNLYAFLRLRCPDVPALDLQRYLVGLGHLRLRELLRGWACYLLRRYP